MAEFFIYRLFDAEKPAITRYVGCTENVAKRERQHADPNTNTTSLVRPWAAWLKCQGRRPQLEIIATLDCSLDEARKVESESIAKAAIDNQWLLNGMEWRRDKVANGISKHVVNAYVTLVSHVNFRKGYSYGSSGAAAQDLERAFPRLKIFHYRFIRLRISETAV